MGDDDRILGFQVDAGINIMFSYFFANSGLLITDFLIPCSPISPPLFPLASCSLDLIYVRLIKLEYEAYERTRASLSATYLLNQPNYEWEERKEDKSE